MTAGLAMPCAVTLTCVAALCDVPKVFCHNCEVTCFEDSAEKYDREVIQPNVTGRDRRNQKAGHDAGGAAE